MGSSQGLRCHTAWPQMWDMPREQSSAAQSTFVCTSWLDIARFCGDGSAYELILKTPQAVIVRTRSVSGIIFFDTVGISNSPISRASWTAWQSIIQLFLTRPWYLNLQEINIVNRTRLLQISGQHTHSTSWGGPGCSASRGHHLRLPTSFVPHGKSSGPARTRSRGWREHQDYQNRPISGLAHGFAKGYICGIHTLAMDNMLLTRKGVQNSDLRSPSFICSRKIRWSRNCEHGWSQVK